jgi:hypothetical protein
MQENNMKVITFDLKVKTYNLLEIYQIDSRLKASMITSL